MQASLDREMALQEELQRLQEGIQRDMDEIATIRQQRVGGDDGSCEQTIKIDDADDDGDFGLVPMDDDKPKRKPGGRGKCTVRWVVCIVMIVLVVIAAAAGLRGYSAYVDELAANTGGGADGADALLQEVVGGEGNPEEYTGSAVAAGHACEATPQLTCTCTGPPVIQVRLVHSLAHSFTH